MNVDPATRTLPLRPVRGPSALGGGSRRFFDLLWLVAVTNFKKTYFGTVLGYLWSLVRPLMLFAVLLFVFTRIFRLGSQVPDYPVLLLLNIVLFTFFQEATGAAVESVVAQEGIVRKTQFPRLVIPLAIVLTAGMNLAVNLIAVFAFILAYGVDPMASWLLFPAILIPLVMITSAFAMLLSALYVRFRDVSIIWSVVATVLFYGTPILYTIEFVPPGFKNLLLFNPLAPLFEQARAWIIDPSAPGAATASGGALRLLVSVVVFVVICVAAVWAFRREAPRIAESL
jgi:ABC-2 type transport system permease protein